MKPREITLDQVVTFAILMEHNDGITSKSPRYIMEKFMYCMQETDLKYLKAILDDTNQAKFELWEKRWK